MSLFGAVGPLSRADAYGLGGGGDGNFLTIQVNQTDRLYPGRGIDPVDAGCSQIQFEEADIEGTFAVAGKPGVIGLWLSTFTVIGAIPDPVVDNIDLASMSVPDLRPAENGYMYVRGFVWPHWDGVSVPEPRRHAYP